ncbi:hypothetical protein B296_00043799 [Ensete ventricosum]|uniref:Uncharacterized protein n=1 Tax=Ensete ventricosum TaxID=4639 RepID=A0A426YSD1_ENSVE|nr:hypothetical protein B296_00043799 [Ensete ventricosum]
MGVRHRLVVCVGFPRVARPQPLSVLRTRLGDTSPSPVMRLRAAGPTALLEQSPSAWAARANSLKLLEMLKRSTTMKMVTEMLVILREQRKRNPKRQLKRDVIRRGLQLQKPALMFSKQV